MKRNYFVKVKNTCRDENRIILTPKLSDKNESKRFCQKEIF